MQLDHKIARIIVLVLFFAVPGCAILYGVFRGIKSGRVILFNKVTGKSGFLLRKNDQRGFWFPIVVYSAIGIFLICITITGIIHVLAAKGSL